MLTTKYLEKRGMKHLLVIWAKTAIKVRKINRNYVGENGRRSTHIKQLSTIQQKRLKNHNCSFTLRKKQVNQPILTSNSKSVLNKYKL